MFPYKPSVSFFIKQLYCDLNLFSKEKYSKKLKITNLIQ